MYIQIICPTFCLQKANNSLSLSLRPQARQLPPACQRRAGKTLATNATASKHQKGPLAALVN